MHDSADRCFIYALTLVALSRESILANPAVTDMFHLPDQFRQSIWEQRSRGMRGLRCPYSKNSHLFDQAFERSR
jgi:hypothetical protein